MVNGRPEQAEFPVDCPPLDIKGRDWCLGWQLCSHFKEKPRLDDCSQKITAGVSCCHRFNHSRLFWLVRKVAYGAAKMQLLLTACHSTAASDYVRRRLSILLNHFVTLHRPNNSMILQPFCLFVCFCLFVIIGIFRGSFITQSCPAAGRPFQICSALQPRQDPMTSWSSTTPKAASSTSPQAWSPTVRTPATSWRWWLLTATVSL